MNATVKEWLDKAEEDFHILERESRVRKFPSYNGICFHAQQCIEKYLKATLLDKGISPPRVHDLTLLNEEVQKTGTVLDCTKSELRTLSMGAVLFRYPGESADRQFAKELRAICKKLRTQFLAFFPVHFPDDEPKHPKRRMKNS